MDMRRCAILPIPTDAPAVTRFCLMVLPNQSPLNRCMAPADFVLATTSSDGRVGTLGIPLCQQHANDCITFGAAAPGD